VICIQQIASQQQSQNSTLRLLQAVDWFVGKLKRMLQQERASSDEAGQRQRLSAFLPRCIIYARPDHPAGDYVLGIYLPFEVLTNTGPHLQ
jgi:hypothetical protein